MNSKRPNILHIVTDQQRFDTIAALGNQQIFTPNLDRLVREGTAFTSAYTPSPECVPARCCMITGKYADKTGCASNADSMVDPSYPTVMSLLADSGYRTHGVGKCHFTPDPWAMRGFHTRDRSEELPDHLPEDDYYNFVRDNGYGHVLEPYGARGEMYYIPQPSPLPSELHHSHWVGDRCIEFFRSQRDSSRPFYCFAGFIQPHPPFSPPGPWHKLYRGPEMEKPFLPDNADDLVCFINHFQNRFKYRDGGFDNRLVGCIRAYYYACISFIDFQIGRLMDDLEEQGVLEETLIVFTSDHGEMLGDFKCFGKRSFHDAAMRIPLLVRYPHRFEMGTSCPRPASLVDLLPTFMGAAGLATDLDCDGIDLYDLVSGQAPREGVFTHFDKGENALYGFVNERHKYAWSAPDQKAFLFSRNDFPETENIAGRDIKTCGRLEQIVRDRASQNESGKKALDAGVGWRSFSPKKMPSDPDKGLIYQDPNHSGAVDLPPGYPIEYPRQGTVCSDN